MAPPFSSSRGRCARAWLLAAASTLALGCARAPASASAPAAERASATAETVVAPTPPLDPRWQVVVDEEAQRIAGEFPGSTVRIVVLDPSTQTTLAEHGPVDTQHFAGSTMKGLTAAAALARGADPEARLDCRGPTEVAGASVQDYRPNGELSLREGIARSSNVCTVELVKKIGWKALHEDVRAILPLPERTDAEERAAVFELFGADARVSTRNLAGAYATIANDGVDARTGQQWIPVAAARQVRQILRFAVEQGTGDGAHVDGRHIEGKTGTAPNAQTHTALFVGIVPDGDASTVVAVVVEGLPRSETGGTVAAPSFARVVQAGPAASVSAEKSG